LYNLQNVTHSFSSICIKCQSLKALGILFCGKVYTPQAMIQEIQHALSSSHQDFEDSIQIFTALNGNIDYIVTRNIKDFQKSPVKVNTPDQLLQSLNHSST
jgi:hypothetical protein